MVGHRDAISHFIGTAEGRDRSSCPSCFVCGRAFRQPFGSSWLPRPARIVVRFVIVVSPVLERRRVSRAGRRWGRSGFLRPLERRWTSSSSSLLSAAVRIEAVALARAHGGVGGHRGLLSQSRSCCRSGRRGGRAPGLRRRERTCGCSSWPPSAGTGAAAGAAAVGAEPRAFARADARVRVHRRRLQPFGQRPAPSPARMRVELGIGTSCGSGGMRAGRSLPGSTCPTRSRTTR